MMISDGAGSNDANSSHDTSSSVVSTSAPAAVARGDRKSAFQLFARLDTHVCCEIFRYSDPLELGRYAILSKQLRVAVEHGSLWKRFVQTDSPLSKLFQHYWNDPDHERKVKEDFLTFPKLRKEPWWRVDDEGRKWKFEQLHQRRANAFSGTLSASYLDLPRKYRLELRDGTLDLEEAMELARAAFDEASRRRRERAD